MCLSLTADNIRDERPVSTGLLNSFLRWSFSVLLYSLGSSHEDVYKASDPVSEDNDDDPYDLIVSFGGFFGGAVDDGPNPEGSPPDADHKEYKNKEQPKDTHASFLSSKNVF